MVYPRQPASSAVQYRDDGDVIGGKDLSPSMRKAGCDDDEDENEAMDNDNTIKSIPSTRADELVQLVGQFIVAPTSIDSK